MRFFPAALALVLAWGTGMALAQTAAAPVITVEFKHPEMSPSYWKLELHPDGSGHFRSQHRQTRAASRLEPGDVDRALTLSPGFASRVFALAERKHAFQMECESHLKVALQGWKTVSYSGPAGQGSCTFNYSNDKEINQLGEQMVAVASTIEAGARLEMLLAHDRLGLDRETEFLVGAAHDGRIRQLCAIRPILERLASDDSVLERVRKRASQLMALD